MAVRECVRAADGFLLAMDVFMRRHGQGAQLTASVLVIEDLVGEPCPDLTDARL